MEVVHLAGVLLAVLAAGLLATQNIAVRLATDGTGVSRAVLIVMAINLGVIGPAAAIVHFPSYGLSWRAAGAFATAGVVGLVLGRVCMYGAIKSIGASRTTPLVSASTFVTALLAIWLLGESVTVPHGIGIVLIVFGIAAIAWSTAADAGREASLRDVGASLVLPLGAAFFIGVEPIFVRVGLDDGTPVLVGLAVMMAAALASYLAYLRIRGGGLAGIAATPNLRWCLVAGVTSTFGLLSYFAALRAAPVVVAIPLIHTAPLIVIALSVAFLPQRLERVTLPLVVGAAVVVAGAILVSVSG